MDKPNYRCSHCGYIKTANKRQAWIRGYCPDAQRTVHMVLLDEKGVAIDYHRRAPERPMTAEEFEARMKEISKNGDTEEAHARADDLLCAVLRQLGYWDGVTVFEEMDKWYA